MWDNIIQFVPSDGPVFGEAICNHPYLSMVNFTGSVATFQHINMEVAKNLPKFKTFPAMIGECGGKNYHFVHNSADVKHVAVGTIRSAFEYGGQKCSACSRYKSPGYIWDFIICDLEIRSENLLEIDFYKKKIIFMFHIKTSSLIL